MRLESWCTRDMDVRQAKLDCLLVIEPRCFRDERGFFLESFHAERYRAYGIVDHFVQDNHSRSRQNVLRELHFQIKRPQAQIVTVMRGRIFDVVVDLRRGSGTFGRWHGVELSDKGPPGFAHGFCVLSEFADLHYKVTQLYDHEDEAGLIWNDRDVGIRWPLAKPIVSERDSAYPGLRQLDPSHLPQFVSPT